VAFKTSVQILALLNTANKNERTNWHVYDIYGKCHLTNHSQLCSNQVIILL